MPDQAELAAIDAARERLEGLEKRVTEALHDLQVLDAETWRIHESLAVHGAAQFSIGAGLMLFRNLLAQWEREHPEWVYSSRGWTEASPEYPIWTVLNYGSGLRSVQDWDRLIAAYYDYERRKAAKNGA